jgi:hypothetical protein
MIPSPNSSSGSNTKIRALSLDFFSFVEFQLSEVRQFLYRLTRQQCALLGK